MLGEEVGVAEQTVDQPSRVDGRPHLVDVRLHRLAARHRVLYPVVGGVARVLHPHQDRVGEPVREHGAGSAVADPPAAQLGEELLDLVRRDAPPARAAGDDQPLGGGPDVGPHRPAQHVGEPAVPLEGRDGGGVGATHGVLGAEPGQRPGGQLLDRRVLGVDLAQGGEDVADVAKEAGVGSYDQDALARELVAVGIEEVGGAVQPDRGLAGPRCPLDADRLRHRRPHDDVLLGLDGRHYVAHRPDPGALDLLLEDAGVGRRDGRRPEGLVLERGDLSGGEPEPATQSHPHRLGAARPVERTG